MIDEATILVADDSPDDVELIKRAIQKAGLANPIKFMSDGDQVIDYFKASTTCGTPEAPCPLLMFLDLNMPHCTGFAVLDWLRQQPHLRNFPTIVFSSSDEDSDIERSFRLGAKGYWVKPSRFEDLVRMMVRLKEILREAVRKADVGLPIAVAA